MNAHAKVAASVVEAAETRVAAAELLQNETK